MPALLSETEKHKVRYHLGYLSPDPVVSIQLGVPRASQPMFLVESAMNNLPAEAVGNVRRIVVILDGVEERLVQAQDRLAAKQVGNITMREDEPLALEREYRRWAERLADFLGVPLNVYSQRFRGGAGALNVAVQN